MLTAKPAGTCRITACSCRTAILSLHTCNRSRRWSQVSTNYQRYVLPGSRASPAWVKPPSGQCHNVWHWPDGGFTDTVFHHRIPTSPWAISETLVQLCHIIAFYNIQSAKILIGWTYENKGRKKLGAHFGKFVFVKLFFVVRVSGAVFMHISLDAF